MTAYAYARVYREETSRLVLMSAALPGFGLEEFMDFSEPRGGRYHLVFFQQPEVPERLIQGRERYYLGHFTGGEAVVGAEALDEYVRACSRPGRLGAALGQYRAIYEDAEDNREKAMPKLEMPVLALGDGSAEPALESARRVPKTWKRASCQVPATTCTRSGPRRSPTGCWTSSTDGPGHRDDVKPFAGY